uniref:C2H2-type domain-containing protein n=1 Tax=Anopheles epiroticus TaxID=199890 RepID=A0A182P3S1_9DIPT
MEPVDCDPAVSSSSSGVTVLQYLLQNESTGAIVGGESQTSSSTIGAGPSVRIYPCTHPGCKKTYLNEEHQKAHEKYHSGDVPSHRKQAEVREGHMSADAEEKQSGLRFLLQNGQFELLPKARDSTEEIGEEEVFGESSDEEGNGKQPESIVVECTETNEDDLIEYEGDDARKDVEFENSFIQYEGSDCEATEAVEMISQEAVSDTDSDEDEDSSLDEPKQHTYSAKERKYVCEWPRRICYQPELFTSAT